MTYRGDFAPAYHPPADFVAYQNDAYDADGSRVMLEPQGEIGRLMQQLTWFSTIFPAIPPHSTITCDAPRSCVRAAWKRFYANVRTNRAERGIASASRG